MWRGAIDIFRQNYNYNDKGSRKNRDKDGYKKILKYVIVLVAVIALFFVGIRNKIFSGYYMPNINFIIEHSIEQNTKQFYKRNIKDIQIILKKEYNNDLYVLFEYIEDGDKEFAVYIYPKSNIGLLKAKTPATSLSGRWLENDGIILGEITLMEDYDTLRTVVFIYGNNENNYKKVVLERYVDGEKVNSIIEINEGYFMEFIDLGVYNTSVLNAYFDD